MRVKICGITRVEDARFAEACGADAIGVVMFSNSPRSVSPERAEEIFSALGPLTATVAVTHTQSSEALRAMLALHPTAVQISHLFDRAQCRGVKVIRVVRKGNPLPDDGDAVVVDESMGSGRPFDLTFAREVAARLKVPVILAGGLTAENVRKAIARVSPYAVDVASGVEDAPGVKNHKKVRAFIRACKEEIP
jgi:phosphoribosylanthranilate isomerase